MPKFTSTGTKFQVPCRGVVNKVISVVRVNIYKEKIKLFDMTMLTKDLSSWVCSPCLRKSLSIVKINKRANGSIKSRVACEASDL